MCLLYEAAVESDVPLCYPHTSRAWIIPFLMKCRFCCAFSFPVTAMLLYKLRGILTCTHLTASLGHQFSPITNTCPLPIFRRSRTPMHAAYQFHSCFGPTRCISHDLPTQDTLSNLRTNSELSPHYNSAHFELLTHHQLTKSQVLLHKLEEELGVLLHGRVAQSVHEN